MKIPESEQERLALTNSLIKAEESALVVQHPSPGLLKLSGSSSLDLLNRMSTNNLLDLSQLTLRETVLTTAHARIIDRIWVIYRDDDLIVMTSPGAGEMVSSWLRQHIFFQDDVQVSMMTTEWAHLGVYGPDASHLLTSIITGADHPVGNEIKIGEGMIFWSVENPIPGIHFLVDISNTGTWQRFSDRFDDPTTTGHTYEILRIKAGLPSSPNEINGDYIPLELGLWDAVSFSKGCYTGQEIIARLESRGKLARHLVGIDLSENVPLGSSIFQGKRDLGKLTSIIFSPDDGWIGLAVIKPFKNDDTDEGIAVGTARIKGKIVQFS
jgi:aminomethyltransferase